MTFAGSLATVKANLIDFLAQSLDITFVIWAVMCPVAIDAQLRGHSIADKTCPLFVKFVGRLGHDVVTFVSHLNNDITRLNVGLNKRADGARAFGHLDCIPDVKNIMDSIFGARH